MLLENLFGPMPLKGMAAEEQEFRVKHRQLSLQRQSYDSMMREQGHRS